ncbi:MAG TPA: hypothetical protein VJ840_14665, partial [Gemmatimonadaceae bacterium]|nr:hypothetical protein [Gemmatimonadaceae bacterium]
MSSKSNRRVIRFLTLLGVTAGALFSFTSSLSAQGTVGTITGVVTGEGGVPVSGVQVSVVNQGIGAIT